MATNPSASERLAALLLETLALAEKLGAGHVKRVIDAPTGVTSADINALVPLRARIEAALSVAPSAGAMEHDIDSEDCWCKPEILQPCPDCEVDETGCRYKGGRPSKNCWHCQGRGLIARFDEESPVIIVHRYPKEAV